MKKSPNMLEMISANNQQRLVKIRYTQKKTGKVILYLEHYHDKKRERKHLGVVLSMDPADKHIDLQKLRYVEILRSTAEKTITEGGALNAMVIHQLFHDFAVKVVESKNEKNKLGYYNAINRFNNMYPNLPISDLTADKMARFIKSISHLKPSSINHYVGYMRHICHQAVKVKLMRDNPFQDIPIMRVDRPIEYLEYKELVNIEKAECTDEEVKRAFLWSCYTGMRLGDVYRVTRSQINDGYLSFRQSKTGRTVRIKLCKQALEIAGKRQGTLFNLPAYKTLRKHLKTWLENAGIIRHITFHCARHTFATLLVTLGIDIYVICKLMGHSDVRITQIYAKLIDAKKDEAIDVLSGLGK